MPCITLCAKELAIQDVNGSPRGDIYRGEKSYSIHANVDFYKAATINRKESTIRTIKLIDYLTTQIINRKNEKREK